MKFPFISYSGESNILSDPCGMLARSHRLSNLDLAKSVGRWPESSFELLVACCSYRYVMVRAPSRTLSRTFAGVQLAWRLDVGREVGRTVVSINHVAQSLCEAAFAIPEVGSHPAVLQSTFFVGPAIVQEILTLTCWD